MLDIYFTNILIRTLFLAVVVVTVDILWGYMGILTFGQSAFFGVGAYACGLIFTHYGFSPGWALAAFGIALGLAALIAAATCWLAFFHGSSPIYASIITLALPIVITQVIYSGGTFTGSSSGLSGFPTFDFGLEVWFWIAGAFLVFTTTAGWLLVRSDFGRVMIAIRENEERSAYLGIPVSRIKAALMIVSAMLASAAGFGYAAFSNVVAPELAGFQLGTELLIWTALGGRATLLGPVFATIGIDTISSWLSGTLPFLWKLLTGIAFVLVIVALPRGLAPVVGAALARVCRKRPSQPPKIALVRAPGARMLRPSFSDTPPLHIDHLTRSYGSLKVLKDVTLTGYGTELLSIVGPNGAGKTTLMRCISDGTERTGGDVRINGNGIERGSPQHIVGLGVGRSFQNTNLFDTLTVVECLKLSRYRIDGAKLFHRTEAVALPEPALDILKATGLDLMLSQETRNLSHGMKRGLELAMVLATEPSVLLLDEPTAGLTQPERVAIGAVLTRLTKEFGLCIVLIEHDLDFVRAISDRLVVLHHGAILMEGTVEDVVTSDLVKTAYTGH
ncbi:branched-chain amino acid ABC transporter ATP-binding protein/permease [Pseudomonas veronii]|uniref:branched-chain amino acid ABC transporter ATP-binding protein/permease n=1 Tax=Pseudomonas veronii TaxID=76761 RepID=UPI001C431DB0